MNSRNMQKITVLVMLLFLSSTVFIAIKTKMSFSAPSGDGELSATSTPMVYVDPKSTTKDIDETFTIDIVVADVSNLYGVDIQFRWDPTILEYVSHTAKIPVETHPDGILHQPGMLIINITDKTAGTYWIAYSSFDPAPVFDGTGIVFSMTFRVLKAGGCALEFPKDPRTGVPLTGLSDLSGLPITHTCQDGYFETVGIPQADFTWQPQIGVVGKPTFFNASESVAPGGTIVMYYWDFGDLNTTASTSPEITHVFTHSVSSKLYVVSLKVKNDAGVNSSATTGQVTIVESRNIKIESISLSTGKTRVNSTVTANVTITNTGYTTENSTLAAYYNTSATEWTMIAIVDVVNLKSKEPRPYSFVWNTTGVETEKDYVIKANATAVPYGNETDNTKISQPVFITSKTIYDLAVETLMLQASYGASEFAMPVILDESALFTIDIKNNGTVPVQSYDVVVYSNGTSLYEWNIAGALNTGATKTFTYTWAEISQRGLYNITVQVVISTGDNNTHNNQLQQMMRVIATPILNITYTPETLILNQTIVLNASSSVHGDPEGQLTSYEWEIWLGPIEQVGVGVPAYRSAESEISTSYKFTEEGNWTIVLRVKDNYGITWSGTRDLTNAYRLMEEIDVKVEGDGEDGGGIPIEYIAVIIVVVVVAIAAFVLVRRRRTGLAPTE